MSTFKVHTATCPACGHTGWKVEIAQGLHITRLPEIKQQLLAGTFQTHRCPKCEAPAVFEAPVVYTDFDRGEYVAVENARTGNWQAAITRHQTVFRDCFELGPPIAQEMAARFKRRIVYGYRALREKLLVWDAGLDDRAVEAVKGDLLADEGEAPREVVLRVSRILDGGHLLFSLHDPVPRPAEVPADQPFVLALPPARDFLTATADRVAARMRDVASATRDYPWLQDDWFVDLHDGPSYLYQ